MKFCDECGATLEDDVWFCDECGANIEKPSETKKDDDKIADKKIIDTTSSRDKKRNYKNIILVIASMIIVSISSVFVTFAITNRDNKDDNTKVASVEAEKRVEKEVEEITTEEVTTVEETTTEEVTTQVIDYKKYISILSEIQNNYNSYNSYTIHDLNNDGICELLVESGQASSSYEWSIYSIYDNNVVFVDRFTVADTLLYDGEDGSIFLQSTRMGYETIKKLTYDGKTINEEKIIEREISADEEYLSFDKALKMYYITDYSLIP